MSNMQTRPQVQKGGSIHKDQPINKSIKSKENDSIVIINNHPDEQQKFVIDSDLI